MATKYISRVADENGHIHWSDEENSVWQELITRQLKCVENKACDEYKLGSKLLNLPHDRIPQLAEVSKVLKETTGWQCEPVPALIGFGAFFKLLSEKKFPVATFIRSREEFDYLLNKVSDLDDLRKFEVADIMELVEQAQALGLHPAKFPAKEINNVS